MAQKKHDMAAQFGKSVRNCLPEENTRDDSVTLEGMALVRARTAKYLAGRTFRSLSDPGRIVRVG